MGQVDSILRVMYNNNHDGSAYHCYPHYITMEGRWENQPEKPAPLEKDPWDIDEETYKQWNKAYHITEDYNWPPISKKIFHRLINRGLIELQGNHYGLSQKGVEAACKKMYRYGTYYPKQTIYTRYRELKQKLINYKNYWNRPLFTEEKRRDILQVLPPLTKEEKHLIDTDSDDNDNVEKAARLYHKRNTSQDLESPRINGDYLYNVLKELKDEIPVMFDRRRGWSPRRQIDSYDEIQEYMQENYHGQIQSDPDDKSLT